MLKQGKKAETAGSLSEALRQYLNALNCDSQLAGQVGPNIQRVCEKVEAQKVREARAKELANQRQQEAEWGKERGDQKAEEVEEARQVAHEARQKAEIEARAAQLTAQAIDIRNQNTTYTPKLPITPAGFPVTIACWQ